MQWFIFLNLCDFLFLISHLLNCFLLSLLLLLLLYFILCLSVVSIILEFVFNLFLSIRTEYLFINGLIFAAGSHTDTHSK